MVMSHHGHIHIEGAGVRPLLRVRRSSTAPASCALILLPGLSWSAEFARAGMCADEVAGLLPEHWELCICQGRGVTANLRDLKDYRAQPRHYRRRYREYARWRFMRTDSYNDLLADVKYLSGVSSAAYKIIYGFSNGAVMVNRIMSDPQFDGLFQGGIYYSSARTYPRMTPARDIRMLGLENEEDPYLRPRRHKSQHDSYLKAGAHSLRYFVPQEIGHYVSEHASHSIAKWCEEGAKMPHLSSTHSLSPESLSSASSNTTADPKGEEGNKKPPLGLIPKCALEDASHALALGAKKYGPWNWRKNNVEATTYLHAALRHIYQFIDGEDLDHESGATHLGHAIASLAILQDARENGTLRDNRPIKKA